MNLIYNWNKRDKLKLIFYQPSKEVIDPWAQSRQQSLSTILPFASTILPFAWWPFHPSEFWTGCRFGLWRLMKSSQKLQFWYHHFFPQVFSMFLSLKANLSLKGYLILLNEMNQDYKVRSLGLKRVGKWTMCPLTF